MPFWSGVVRILRRRIVLGIIFGLSVTYCGVSLFLSDRKGITLGSDLDSSNANNLLFNNDDDVAEGEEGGNMYKVQNRDLPWQTDNEQDKGNDNSLMDGRTDTNKSESITKFCRNSIQGKILIVDDKGYVCPRQEILPNGCCMTVLSTEIQLSNIGKKERYSCNSCNAQGCCAIYEYCVSCCLHPSKYVKPKKLEGESVRKENLKARRGEDILKLRLRNLDRFQVCLAACRTSSASVRHENTYKDPHSKHCYNLNHITNLQQRPRRDLIAVNNNANNTVALITPFSVVMSFSTFPKSQHFPETNIYFQGVLQY